MYDRVIHEITDKELIPGVRESYALPILTWGECDFREIAQPAVKMNTQQVGG